MTRTGALKRVSFVVRVVQDPSGRISGVIERVATGAKEAFTGVEVIGQLVAKMLEHERTDGERPDDRGSC